MTDQRHLRLIDVGVRMSVCAYGCQQHGPQTVTVDSRVSLSGLMVLCRCMEKQATDAWDGQIAPTRVPLGDVLAPSASAAW